jgi:hypothetical protein
VRPTLQYKLCSKFAHPTAWVVRTASSVEADTDVRNMFFDDGVVLAFAALAHLEQRFLTAFPEFKPQDGKKLSLTPFGVLTHGLDPCGLLRFERPCFQRLPLFSTLVWLRIPLSSICLVSSLSSVILIRTKVWRLCEHGIPSPESAAHRPHTDPGRNAGIHRCVSIRMADGPSVGES